mgnify:CR=1 FL=1
MEVLKKLAIHEAYNSRAYGEVQLYEWDPLGTNSLILYWTSKPAKKIVFKMKAGHAASNYEDTDYLIIVLNNIGVSDLHKQIKVDIKNGLPFTIEGVLITQLNIVDIIGYHADLDTDRDYIDIISYH